MFNYQIEIDEENKENIHDAAPINGLSDPGLAEEELLLSNLESENKQGEDVMQRAALVLKMREGMACLARVLKTIESLKGVIVHLESRPSQEPQAQFDVLIKVDMTSQNLLLLIRSLRQSSFLSGVSLLDEKIPEIKSKCRISFGPRNGLFLPTRGILILPNWIV